MIYPYNTGLFEKNEAEVFVWKKHENLGYPAHFHEGMEICFVLQGKCEIILNGTNYVLEEGDISIANHLCIHTYKKTEFCNVAVLILGSNYTSDFNNLYKNQALKPHLNDKEYNKTILAILDDVPASFKNNESLSVLAKKAYANLIFDKIIAHYSTNKSEQYNQHIMDIVSYIYQNYNKEITLESLAKTFNYTMTSISRFLSKYLRTDLRCFINNLRVEHAELMLNDTKYAHLSIMEIAYLCGFNSAATFYRTYKRRYNRLPRTI